MFKFSIVKITRTLYSFYLETFSKQMDKYNLLDLKSSEFIKLSSKPGNQTKLGKALLFL